MKKTVKLFGIIALVAVIGFSFAACGGDDDNGGNGGGGGKDELDGTTWRSGSNDTGNFSVTFNSPNFTWSAPGSIRNGTYTISGNTVTLTIPNVQTITGTLSGNTLTINGMVFTKDTGNGSGDTAPAVTTASLPNGTVGTAYSQTLTATGSTPITWSIDTGSLPNGLTLSTAGVISGTPTTANTFNFTVKATNATGNGTKPLSIVIATSGGGNGTFTLSGIPSTHNGKYAYLNVFGSDSAGIYGWESINSTTGMITLSPISNGSVSLPLWNGGEEGGRYSGNHTGSVSVVLFNAQVVDPADIPSAIGYIVFSNVTFANGSATRAWNVGQYAAQ